MFTSINCFSCFNHPQSPEERSATLEEPPRSPQKPHSPGRLARLLHHSPPQHELGIGELRLMEKIQKEKIAHRERLHSTSSELKSQEGRGYIFRESRKLEGPNLVFPVTSCSEVEEPCPSAIVAPGLNLLAECNTATCAAYTQDIWISLGFGRYTVGPTDCLCPLCEKVVKTVKNIGIFNSYYRIGIDSCSGELIHEKAGVVNDNQMHLLFCKDHCLTEREQPQVFTWKDDSLSLPTLNE